MACLSGQRGMSDVLDIAVIGSGPAGLSAAARAAARGLSYLLIEKTDHLSDTIYKYQKFSQKLMTKKYLIKIHGILKKK